MTVKALTPIEHGLADGKIKHFNVGDTLDEGTFGADVLSEMIANGSAVELGKNRKYSPDPEVPLVPVDEATLLRDDLLRQAGTPMSVFDTPLVEAPEPEPEPETKPAPSP